MNSISSIFLLVVVSFCLHHHRAASDLVSEACGAARFQSVCESTLRADPSSKSADIQGLAKIALTAAAHKSHKILTKIPKVSAGITDPRTLQALKDCTDNYESATQQIKDSLGAIDSKRYFDANTWVTAAMSDSDSCEDGLQPGTSALTQDNERFGQLSSNVLAIVNKASGRA